MSTTSLPVDPEKPGNVWCEDCQQSIGENRAAAHLVSKKHLGNAAPPADADDVKPKKGAKKAAAAVDLDDDNEAEAAADAEDAKPKKGAGKGAATSGKHSSGLPEDPEKAGNRWCGICQVSLASSKADAHIETARHKDNTMKHLTNAMRATKVSK